MAGLLQSEISERQARCIRYQLSIAKLPLAKDDDDFDFADTPVNESLVLCCSFALGRQDVSFIARSGAMAKKAGANLHALPVVIQPILL